MLFLYLVTERNSIEPSYQSSERQIRRYVTLYECFKHVLFLCACFGTGKFGEKKRWFDWQWKKKNRSTSVVLWMQFALAKSFNVITNREIETVNEVLVFRIANDVLFKQKFILCKLYSESTHTRNLNQHMQSRLHFVIKIFGQCCLMQIENGSNRVIYSLVDFNSMDSFVW